MGKFRTHLINLYIFNAKYKIFYAIIYSIHEVKIIQRKLILVFKIRNIEEYRRI